MQKALKEDTTPTLPLREYEDLPNPHDLGEGRTVGIAYRFAEEGLRYICGAKVSRYTSKSTAVELPLDGREITFAASSGIQWGKHNPQSHPERWELVKHIPPEAINPGKYDGHHFAEPYAEEPFTQRPIGKPSDSEVYRFLYLEFDVQKAFEIIRDNPRKPISLNTEEWCGPLSRYMWQDEYVKDPEAILQYRRDPEADSWKMTMGTGVEWEAVPRADPRLAGIMAYIAEGYQIVDGSHRLSRAWQVGQESFPAYALTAQESLKVCPQLEDIREEMGTTGGG